MIKEDGDFFAEAVQSLSSEIQLRFETDPIRALEILQQDVMLPDLIFLDLNMPAVSGEDIRKKLRREERLKDIPVILYSSYSKTAVELLFKDRGRAAVPDK